jgi:polyphosphate kinase
LKLKKQNKIINRELSWLAFNHRVLQEAADTSVPLVERIRFLGIFSNNQDEFFKVRVASVQRMLEFEPDAKKLIGGKPHKILNKIQKIVISLQKEFDKTFINIVSELEKENIYIINETQLNESQKHFVTNYFHEKVLSALSPIMLNNIDSLPELKDKSIYFAVKLTSKNTKIADEYALIEIPTKEIPRFIVLPEEENIKYIILLDDVIRACLKDVFSIFNFDHFEAYTIKITRDAELDIDNDLTISFLEKISKSVKERKKGQPVRFVYDSTIPDDLFRYFTSKLELDESDNLIPGGRYHNFKDFIDFPNIGSRSLEYKKILPAPHPRIKSGYSILDQITLGDFLLHCPYHNFTQFINLLRESAIDPNVTSIMIALYRVARFSKVINALINAAQNGKSVTVVIELQARFDEESNIYWSKKLEEAGAKVIFGVPGFKIHSKLILITKTIDNKQIRFGCIGTGNFHEGTAEIYSDTFLFTTDPRITQEIRKVFRFIENPIKPITYKHLIVSPVYARRKLKVLINREIRNAREGKKAYIIIKLNSLVDKEMIAQLYKASRAGVKITMLIRGICSLIPGIPGMSENIQAFSIVGRFLEHSRILIFCNNNNELYYISSADWMIRNLDYRIEVTCPVYDPKLKQELRQIIDLQLSDNVKSRIIDDTQENHYKKLKSKRKIDSQIEQYHLISRKQFYT